MKSNLEVYNLLINNGADANLKDYNGFTIAEFLEVAMKSKSQFNIRIGN